MKRLKEDVVKELEFRILSEKYRCGVRLPSERELAEEFSVSRPVVHEALLIVESKGLITLRPRHGAVVNDMKSNGTIDLLSSLLSHRDEEQLSREVLRSLYRVRALMESDAAVLACEKGSEEDWKELAGLIENGDGDDPDSLAERDFNIHHAVARFSGNIVYPLMINSLKPVYLAFLRIFYENSGDSGEIRAIQSELLEAFRHRDGQSAGEIMRRLSSYTLE